MNPRRRARNPAGGLLALRSNMGDSSRTKLALVRDTTLGVGYRLTDNVQLRLGYLAPFRLSEVLQIQADDLPPLVAGASLAAQEVTILLQRRGHVVSECVPGDPSNLERSTPRAGYAADGFRRDVTDVAVHHPLADGAGTQRTI